MVNKYIIKINVLLRYNSHLSPSPNRMERAVGAGADRIKNTCTFSPCWSLPAARRAPPLTQSRTTSQRVTDRSNRPGISESGIRLGRIRPFLQRYCGNAFGRPDLFRAAESTPCCCCKATKNNDTKLWLWQLYHLSGTGSCFWND